MYHEQATDRSSRKWWLAPLVLFVGIPVLVLAGLLLSFAVRQSRAAAELDHAIADLQASGLPVDNRSLASYYESLTDRQRTAQWLRIFKRLDSADFTASAQNMPFLGARGPDDVPLPGDPWAEQEEVEAFLESQQMLLADLHDATGEPEPVYFPVAFDSFETLLPHVQSTRAAARLLLLEHHAAVHAGQGDRAAQSLRSLFGLAETLRGEPFMISQLVRIAIHGMASGALQRSVEQDVLDEEALADLLGRLDAFDDYQTLYRTAIAGERAAALPVYRESPLFVVGSRSRDALVALEYYARMEAIADEEDLAAFVHSSAQLNEQMVAEFAEAGPLQQFETMMSRMLLPASDAFVRAFARQVMQNHLAKLGIGLRLYRHRFGEWPQQLDDLSKVGLNPAELVPLGGKPYGYRVEEGTAILWSFNPAWHSRDASAPMEVPDDPPSLDGRDEADDAAWVWRLAP